MEVVCKVCYKGRAGRGRADRRPQLQETFPKWDGRMYAILKTIYPLHAHYSDTGPAPSYTTFGTKVLGLCVCLS